MSRRLQRTAWTAPRERRWWRRQPLTTGALALALQGVMSAAVLISGGVWTLVPVAAIAFAGVSMNTRNPLALGAAGLLNLIGAAVAFGTGWASVPVLGIFGIGSWASSYLIERAKYGRREQFSEPVAVRNDLLAAGGIVGVSAALTAVVFLVTLLPKIPLVATIPITAFVASVMIIAMGVSVRRTREAVPGNEDYFRVGTALDADAQSTPTQINMNRNIDLGPLLRSNADQSNIEQGSAIEDPTP